MEGITRNGWAAGECETFQIDLRRAADGMKWKKLPESLSGFRVFAVYTDAPTVGGRLFVARGLPQFRKKLKHVLKKGIVAPGIVWAQAAVSVKALTVPEVRKPVEAMPIPFAKHEPTDEPRARPGEPSAPSNDDVDSFGPHDRFRDHCFVYRHFHRPVLLQEILRFIDASDPAEISAIRGAIQARAKAYRGHRKKGRPAAEKDPEFKRLALTQAWQMHVFGWDWKRVVEADGQRPTKPNHRTRQRRLDRLAGILYDALPLWAKGHEVKGYKCLPLEKGLADPRIQQMIRTKVDLPFDSHPVECRKIVLGLARRDHDASEAILVDLGVCAR
jgi:hypothetical protein